MRLKTLSSLTTKMGFPTLFDVPIAGVAVDTRLLKRGDVFFALPGANTDGHQFIEAAAEAGAVAAVVSEMYNGDNFGLILVKVPCPLQGLQYLAHRLVAESTAIVVAITGSVGKTTTKEFTASLLKHKYKVASTPGNSNSQIGIPLTLLNHTDGTEEVLVLEMGMTESGHISRLIEIAPPDVAIITAVELVHACNFESLEGIARAKAEILCHPKTKVGIVARDIEHFGEISRFGTCRKVTFSVGSNCVDYTLKEQNGEVKVFHGNESICLGRVNFPGKHNLHNLLAAVVCANQLGLSFQQIKEGVKTLQLPERRLEMHEKLGALFVNDSYNASAVSVKAALETLPQPAQGAKKIAVLGAMKELGAFSEKCHREVAVKALNHVEVMLCLGNECVPIIEEWRKAGKTAELFQERSELVAALKQQIREGDVVLLKGSRSNCLWKVLEEIE